jgi:hypothetical protein
MCISLTKYGILNMQCLQGPAKKKERQSCQSKEVRNPAVALPLVSLSQTLMGVDPDQSGSNGRVVAAVAAAAVKTVTCRAACQRERMKRRILVLEVWA